MSWNTLWYSHANIVINYKIRAMSQKIYSFELLSKCHSEQNAVLRENLFALLSFIFALFFRLSRSLALPQSDEKMVVKPSFRAKRSFA